MAVLEESDRVNSWATFMDDLSAVREVLALDKAELRAAVDATDDWIDANTAAFNAALPVAARSGLTARQKAQLFMLVAGRRFGVL